MTRGLRERRGEKTFAPSKETLPVVEFELLWAPPRVGHPSVPVRAARPSQLSRVCPTRGKVTLPLNFNVGGSKDAPGMNDNWTAPPLGEIDAARKFVAWLFTLTPASATSNS